MFKVAKWYKIFSIAIAAANFIGAVWFRNVSAAGGWGMCIVLMFLMIEMEVKITKIFKEITKIFKD